MTVAGTIRNRPSAGIVWLAVLALLINALFPASLSAAAGQGSHTGSGWCGTAPSGPEPAKGAALAPCAHCILCPAVASALEPPARVAIAALALVAAVAHHAVGFPIPPQRVPYPPAQPRGPPVAARI